jgi:amidohydrolase
VDAVFGAHVSPDLPAGHVGVRYGKFYAASNPFKIVVHGVSAHGAEREKGVDALGAAAALVNRLIDLPKSLPGKPGVVSVGAFHAGTAENVLADRAEFGGIIRTLGPDARSEMKRLFRRTVDEVVQAWGATAEATLVESYPGVVNDDAMTALAERAVRKLLGDDRVHLIQRPTMTTEDFGLFLQERPGSFYHIGAGCPLPLHNTAFLPDARAAVTAAAVHAAVIAAYLTGETGA